VSEESETVGTQIKKALRNLTIATITLYLVLAGLGFVAWLDSAKQRDEIQQVAVSTNHALCVLRQDLQTRIDSAKEFLVDHPEGFQGVSPAVLQQSIHNQEQTIEALSDLDCPPPID